MAPEPTTTSTDHAAPNEDGTVKQISDRPTGEPLNDTAPPRAAGDTPPANGAGTRANRHDDARADGADDGGDTGSGDAADLRGAPASYEDFSVPDGIEVPADKLERFQGLARQLDLSQSGAQSLIDLQVELTEEAMEQQRSQWAELQSQWVEEVKADKEIGGDRLDEAIAVAMRAVDRFGTPGLKEAMELYGFGNHPDLVRTFYRIGMAISPDAVVSHASGPGAPIDKSVAERVYPDQGRR